MTTITRFDHFFEAMEKNAGAIGSAAEFTFKNPTKVLGGIAALGGASYFVPKLYYLLTEEKKKKHLKMNTELLARLLHGQGKMINMAAGPQAPAPNTYDPIVY